MAAKMHYRDAGVLRTLRALFYRDAGVLRTVRRAYYRDAGVLRLVADWSLSAQLFTATISGVGDTTLPQNASARFELNPDGFAYKTETDGSGGSTRTQLFRWLTGGGAASDYAVIASTESGVAGTGTIGGALDLGSARSWTRNHVGTIGTTSWTIGVSIRPAGGGSSIAGPTLFGLVATNPT